MVVPTPKTATIDDLYKVKGKAELIGGRIVTYMAAGRRHNRVAGRIFRSLDDHANQTDIGEAYTDNMGFAIRPMLRSGRQSFSPDASYYNGSFPLDESKFIEGPPTFAVEVRSPDEYGPRADSEIADKRADYFEAGTQVVWDVDPDSEEIRSYRSDSPDNPTIFRRGDTANAEPAVPGWRVAVDAIFG